MRLGHHSDSVPQPRDQGKGTMFGRLFNLLSGCSHQRISRPLTPASTRGAPKGKTYVVCLDCGRHFAYDLQNMKLGKRLD